MFRLMARKLPVAALGQTWADNGSGSHSLLIVRQGKALFARAMYRDDNGNSGGGDKNQRDGKQFAENSFWKWFKERFKYFCSVTALHGCGHIVREDTPLWERIVWVFIVAVSLIVSVVLLRISWIWNSEYPVVTVIESTHYATWNIPFPAVTVCNLNKISMSTALQFASTL